MKRISPHTRAVLQALLVTLLWSTSWVLIKIGLQNIPSLTFAGLRYALAFLCLLPFALARPQTRTALRNLTLPQWGFLMLLGVLFYTLTQGAQFASLEYLPAITVSMMLSMSAVLVTLLGILFLKEKPSWLQSIGVVVFLAGVGLYFYPVRLQSAQWLGLVIICVGVAANSIASVMSRSVNKKAVLSPLLITLVSMGIGSLLLLVSGLFVQGMPSLGWMEWGIIAWMAVVNTAFAFTLWNRTLQTLTAFESTIINNTMLIQIAILAWLFLGERPSLREWSGLAFSAVGAFLVQMQRNS